MCRAAALFAATLRDVKLADLGAARDVFRSAEREYVATSEHNPARWMPLEALRDARLVEPRCSCG